MSVAVNFHFFPFISIQFSVALLFLCITSSKVFSSFSVSFFPDYYTLSSSLSPIFSFAVFFSLFIFLSLSILSHSSFFLLLTTYFCLPIFIILFLLNFLFFHFLFLYIYSHFFLSFSVFLSFPFPVSFSLFFPYNTFLFLFLNVFHL